MRAASPVISLSFAGCVLAASPALGMGFGRVVNGTQLGQPLDFSAVVKVDADEVLARECVFAEVASGDNKVSPGLVRVTVAGGPGDVERVVRVTTRTPIDEPVVTVNVTVGCTSRVTRQFVAFVDPPGLALAPSAGAGPASVPPSAAPLASSDEAAAPERRSVAEVPAVRREADARSATGRITAPTEPVRKRAAPVVRAAAAGPRLQLDAPTVAVAAPAVTAASAPAPAPVVAAAAPASAADEQAAALARERQRIQALEDELAGLRADAKVQRQALAALQIQVGGTRSQRYANPLVYTLAALSLLLTTTVCALLGRRSRDRAAARWLTSALLARSGEPPHLAVDVPTNAVRPPATPTAAAVERVSPRQGVDAAPSVPAPVVAAAASGRPAGGRSSSVEELIDLEQQADFFIVLGQDDAAIELLKGHVGDGDTASSPAPLLKLLELHQRVGDLAAYDRVRGRIDRHFNARTPDFEADLGRGRALEQHPGVLARLQALWPAPAQALEVLDALVFRRGTAGETFDLPAFRELLFLQAIAADHAGRDGPRVELLRSADDGLPARLPVPVREPTTPGVDLDLPLAPAPLASPRGPMPGRRLPVLTATAPQFDSTETVPSALRRPPDYANESAFVDLELEFPGLEAEKLPR